jgi:hypothetical protein
MLRIALALNATRGKMIDSVTRWVLNTNLTHVSGKIYTWLDAEAWADAQKFKG